MANKIAPHMTAKDTGRLTNIADLLDDGIENNSDLRRNTSRTVETVALPEVIPDGLKQDRYAHTRLLGPYSPRFTPSAGQILHGKFATRKTHYWLLAKAFILFLFVWVPVAYASYRLLASGETLISLVFIIFASALVFYEPYVMLRGVKEKDLEPFDGT